MILRLTEKLGKKIHERPSQSVPIAENPFADWTANLFRADRTQYILVANTVFLYSVVLRGKGINSGNRFIEQTLTALRHFLKGDGLGILYHDFLVPEMGSFQLAKTRDRRVISSLTELIHEAKMRLANYELSPSQTSFRLNDTRLSFLDYGCPREACPREAFRELVDKMGESRASSG